MLGWLKDVVLFKSEKTLSILLVFLALLLFVVYPFFDVRGIGKYIIELLLSLVLISGTFAVERRNLRRIALTLMVVSLLTRWATYVHPSRDLVLVATSLGIVFFTFAIVVVLGRVFAAGPVTRYRVEGAVAVYLLVALTFGSVYALIVQIDPNAFSIDLAALGGTPREIYDSSVAELTYFSFVTLTTVGYGDVTPVNEVAKQFAVLEGLIGQLYPAVLLARLVSMQITSPND